MSQQPHDQPKGRALGGTERTWCRAVSSGTGITVLAFLISKPPNLQYLQNILHTLQSSHPIISSKLHFNPSTNSLSFITPPTPSLRIQPFDLKSTTQILEASSSSSNDFHSILQHELNLNTWQDLHVDADVFFASMYHLPDQKSALVLRLHTAVCDRTTAAEIMREVGLLVVGGVGVEMGKKGVVNMGIEEIVPSGKANKAVWTRGVDVLGYSVNSLRSSNLNFRDVGSPRSSEVMRLEMDAHQTARLLTGCKTRGIKLCGVLAAAGLIAAHSSKHFPSHQREKYAVVTLVDCRSLLKPLLSSNDLGFYHSAIVNTYDIKGGEELWKLAKRTYTSFLNYKNNNRHFSDMNDLNFLMSKAIKNPGLTPSSTLRTAFITVFEEPLIEVTNESLRQEVGLEDYVGCSSVHGVGPSMAVFDMVRDGQLDCACVYPSPVHSREQMEELVKSMKRILVDC